MTTRRKVGAKHERGCSNRPLGALKDQAAFGYVNACGVKFNSPLCILVCSHGAQHLARSGQACRHYLGTKISGKLGGAVRRNLLKRRLRHIVRQLTARDSLAIVFVAKRGVLEISFQELRILVERGVAFCERKLQPKDCETSQISRSRRSFVTV